MDERRRAYATYMTMRSAEGRPTETPTAYLQFYDSSGRGSHLSERLVAFTRDEVVEEFDADAELVRWLLNQMSTYEPTREYVVGLVFDRATILSDVLRPRTA